MQDRFWGLGTRSPQPPRQGCSTRETQKRPASRRRQRHAKDIRRVTFQRAQGAAGPQVSHLQRVVPRRGNRPLAVRRHRHRRDHSRMAR